MQCENNNDCSNIDRWGIRGHVNRTIGFENMLFVIKYMSQFCMGAHQSLNKIVYQDWWKSIGTFWNFQDFNALWFLNETQGFMARMNAHKLKTNDGRGWKFHFGSLLFLILKDVEICSQMEVLPKRQQTSIRALYKWAFLIEEVSIYRSFSKIALKNDLITVSPTAQPPPKKSMKD